MLKLNNESHSFIFSSCWPYRGKQPVAVSNEGGSSESASVASVSPRALSNARRRPLCFCKHESQMSELLVVACEIAVIGITINCRMLSVGWWSCGIVVGCHSNNMWTGIKQVLYDTGNTPLHLLIMNNNRSASRRNPSRDACFITSKSTKIHLQQCRVQKIFPGVIPPDPRPRGGEGVTASL